MSRGGRQGSVGERLDIAGGIDPAVPDEDGLLLAAACPDMHHRAEEAIRNPRVVGPSCGPTPSLGWAFTDGGEVLFDDGALEGLIERRLLSVTAS